MERKLEKRDEKNHRLADQFDETDSTNEKPGTDQQDADEAAPNSFQESKKARQQDNVRKRARQDDPSAPDGKHKEEGKGSKDRDKPYRTIDRSRPK